MKKKTAIILIIILTFLALLLGAVLTIGIVFQKDDFFGIRNAFIITEKDLKKKETVSLTSIQNIEMETESIDIQVYTTNEDEMRVEAYTKDKAKEENLFEIEENENTISIKNRNSKSNICFFCFGNNITIYKVYIPRNYKENIRIQTSSGEVSILGDLNNKNVDLKSSSGDLEIGSVTATNINLQTTSGDVSTKNTTSSTLSIQTSSGDIELGTSEGKVSLNANSGEISVHSLHGDARIHTSSGDVEINSFLITGSSTIDTSSGEVHIRLHEDSNCEITSNTSSGDVRYPNESHKVGKDPYHMLAIKTSSGDIWTKMR